MREGHPIFQRSDLLMQNLLQIADHPLYDNSSRIATSSDFCGLSLEHAESVRKLFECDLNPSGIALLRIQFETLVRGIWVLYSATDVELEKITSPLTMDAQHLAQKMPMAEDMIVSLGKNPQAAAAFDALSEFKQCSWKPLNSYIHAGIHPLARQRKGYPFPFIHQLIRQSNGLAVIAIMQACILTGISDLQKQITPLHARFADCLPDHKNSV
jgi:hypothetical protein